MPKLLVADRGPLALHVLATARQLGYATVALFTPADDGAPHTVLADEAISIPEPEGENGYLARNAILAAARASGADALHPGGSPLAADADFAEALEKAGLRFIGPPAALLRTLSQPENVRTRIKAAGIPVIPGYAGIDQSLPKLERMAQLLGFPLAIRALGAPGIRHTAIVRGRDAFPPALLAAKREAGEAFGSDAVLLEKHLPRARRIAVEIFADSHENVVHFFERDDSLGQAGDFLIAESPAPSLSAHMRETLAIAAITVGMALEYQNSGSITFLLDLEEQDAAGDPLFYFAGITPHLTVGSLLQEVITGQDLVGWQLAVAGGAMLPLMQDVIEEKGHAVAAALRTENPARGFLPSAGRLTHLAFPESRAVRIFASNREGREIPLSYSPLLATLVSHSETRAQALSALSTFLDNSLIEGPGSNRSFLARLLTSPAVMDGKTSCALVTETLPKLLQERPLPGAALAAAAVALFGSPAAGDAFSIPFRLHQSPHWHGALYAENGAVHPFALRRSARHHGVRLQDGSEYTVGEDASGQLVVEASDGKQHTPHILLQKDAARLRLAGASWVVFRHNPRWTAAQRPAKAADRIVAPMPGQVMALHVTPGSHVRAGDRLLLLKAMGKEHWVLAPFTATIENVAVPKGAIVSENELLLTLSR